MSVGRPHILTTRDHGHATLWVALVGTGGSPDAPAGHIVEARVPATYNRSRAGR